MYTIAHIADHNQRSGGHYFDRSTLKFFGQRRSDFRVKTLDDGRIITVVQSADTAFVPGQRVRALETDAGRWRIQTE